MKSHQQRELGPENHTLTPHSAVRTPHSVEVYIDELVLHGFAPGDRYSIGEAVERELARLYGECGVSASLMHHIQGVPIDAGAFNLAPGSTADAIGVQVAQALYKGLTP